MCNNGDCGVGNKEFDSPCGTGPFQSCCPDVNGNGWECCENTCASAFGQQACVEICFSSTEAERCREPDADPQCQVGRCNSGNTHVQSQKTSIGQTVLEVNLEMLVFAKVGNV